MSVNKCNTCFYAKMDKGLEAPCVLCSGYSNWVPFTMYEPHEKAFWVSYKGAVPEPTYDVVEKPKHYMLFEDQGIEVRDVIEKLVKKIEWYPEGLAIADYVQMMQYLMRFMDKNGVEDLKKAKWYLEKLIEAYDESDF